MKFILLLSMHLGIRMFVIDSHSIIDQLTESRTCETGPAHLNKLMKLDM